jgi:hypothetical protein
MRRHPWQILWLLIGCSCIVLITPLKKELKKQQVEDDLSFVGEEGTPTELSIAIGMGLFRSIALDILWMRASSLQQEGRFYEIVQLYDLIGKLQPHNARVWSYSAWNMAYNISVECPPGEERWRWVRHGLERLISHGLKYNPYNLELYKQTAWIYSHKMGKNLDDAHLYYKTKLCELVMEVTESRHFSAIQTLAALHTPSGNSLTKSKRIKDRLKSELGMDLELMAELEEDTYLGPIDWRLAQSQGIYWARMGLKNNRFGQSIIDLERLVYQAQQVLLRQGNLVYRPPTSEAPASLTLWPDYRQAQPMQRMFERQVKLFEEKGNAIGVLSAYRAFIDEAVNLCILSGQEKLAQDLVDRVLSQRPDFLPKSNALELMRLQLNEQLQSMGGDEFSSLVSGLLLRSFWWKGNGDLKQSSALRRHAQRLWILNASKNSTAERSSNRSLKEIETNVLLGIFQGQWFHPQALKKLNTSLSPEQQNTLKQHLEN